MTEMIAYLKDTYQMVQKYVIRDLKKSKTAAANPMYRKGRSIPTPLGRLSATPGTHTAPGFVKRSAHDLRHFWRNQIARMVHESIVIYLHLLQGHWPGLLREAAQRRHRRKNLLTVWLRGGLISPA